MPHIHLTILISARWSVTSFSFLTGRSHFHATYCFAHNCWTISLSLSMIYPYWYGMVPAAWIYSTQFEFWSPQLHQHLHPHSTCHLKINTYQLTLDLHWHHCLYLCDLYWLLDSCNLYKWMSWSLWTCYPLYHSTQLNSTGYYKFGEFFLCITE